MVASRSCDSAECKLPVAETWRKTLTGELGAKTLLKPKRCTTTAAALHTFCRCMLCYTINSVLIIITDMLRSRTHKMTLKQTQS